MNEQLNNKIHSGDRFIDIQNSAFESKNSTVISFLNPFSYYEVVKEESLINDVDIYFSDGALLCILHNLFLPKITRASFDYSSIAEPFLQYVATKNKRIAIIGATTDENTLAVINLKKQFPNLNVVYQRDGYINDPDKTINELNLLKPDVVLVGMGTPYQEHFSIKVKHQLIKSAVIITCGGFLTQTSIKPDYYHPLVKKLGLRWLQRMVLHKHVRDRVLKKYPKFTISYLYKMIGFKFAKK
ncbi:teichoic acid biosynthesis protein A [Pseudoalteromonas atlantica]|uniref:Teichoic acid biosynthesis protein A n=1 Tax=Pseudoalteromonas atlantica TaxID=288 RepID=A0ABQ0UH74_PSEAF|nr:MULTISPECIES: WecB/TagA/CpsF family glycosyltransferase [Pseudoalteromonas]MCK8095596.1 WecB/TagA/CpsF family glycosyltransferase [Pseudoalteromonas sp. 1CM17D]MCW1718703.1 WecB/TagA/CpsF family glycosyltransferase [Pseudoalteromonas sp. A3]GEK77815.1 teichoic acid biosynthesis protein A [Pseudoalteromonas atlantica]